MGLVFSNDFFWLENNTYLNLLGFVLIFGFLKLDLNLLRGWGERGAEAGGHRSPPSRGCDSTWIANQGARRQGLAQGKVVRWHVLAVLSAAGHCHQRPGKQGPAVVSSTQLETPATPNGRASLSPASEACIQACPDLRALPDYCLLCPSSLPTPSATPFLRPGVGGLFFTVWNPFPSS